MQYQKVDTSVVDAMMLIGDEGNHLPSSSSQQQNKILEKKRIRKYRIALCVLLVLLAISLIILLAAILHENEYHYITDSPVLLQSSTCNHTNGASINYSK
jgi:hypothetical protein